MDASRPPIADRTRCPRWGERAACAVTALAILVAAPALAEEGVRLPEWREPTAVADSAAAPRPAKHDPSASDLGLLLREPATTREPRRLPVVETPQRELPRTVRQLEHAATEANTPRELGRLIRLCHQARETATDSESAERIDELLAWAHASRARVRARSGDPWAGDDFAAALDANPADHATRHEYALLLAANGKLEQAIEQLSRVVESSPEDHTAVRNRATLALRAGRVAQAAEDATHWITLLRKAGQDRGDELADAFALRGAAWQAAGRLDAAAADLGVALRLRPGDPVATLARAHVYAERGYYQQAVTDYAAAAAHPKTASDAYRALAWVLATCPDERVRDAANAVEAARRAERLTGETPLTLDAAAAAYAAAGRFDRAVRLQQRVVLASGEEQPSGAAERLALYEEGRPYVAPR